MIETTDVLLLDKLRMTPFAGAILDSVTYAADTPPAAIVEGVSANEASGGGGGSVPPGFSVTT
jgi:hypothetical protein